MKKFDTEYISNKKASLEELEHIIKNLFTEDSEEWISLFDTSKKNKNYIQVHSDIEILDNMFMVIDFIENVLNYGANSIDEKDFYLIEYRKYENEQDFKHYRAFFDKAETIISYFEKYMNDEKIDIEKWIDVTSEFVVRKEKAMDKSDMKKINHKFFGELDLEKGVDNEIDFGNDIVVLWEKDINEINTTLWYDKNVPITTEILDTFADFLNRFDEYNKKARKALEKYLSEDNEYIIFHREELELDLPENVEKFVEYMKITNIGLWLDGENTIIVDYMIEPEESDEILAVKFDSNFEFFDIAWES